MEKEKQKVTFLDNEVKDLQREFELEREEYLDTIRKQERQLKLLLKLTQKIQPLIPHDYNYYNLDKIQSMAIWNEEFQDWILPELKREKLSLPSMSATTNNNDQNGHQQQYQQVNGNGGHHHQDDYYDDIIDGPSAAMIAQHYQHQQALMSNSRRESAYNQQPAQQQPPFVMMQREPEIDRFRLKLENSQFDGSNYFKTKRQSELLSQTQDLKNNASAAAGRLSPINNGGGLRPNRKFY